MTPRPSLANRHSTCDKLLASVRNKLSVSAGASGLMSYSMRQNDPVRH
jgi:hypothetical protein